MSPFPNHTGMLTGLNVCVSCNVTPASMCSWLLFSVLPSTTGPIFLQPAGPLQLLLWELPGIFTQPRLLSPCLYFGFPI